MLCCCTGNPFHRVPILLKPIAYSCNSVQDANCGVQSCWACAVHALLTEIELHATEQYTYCSNAQCPMPNTVARAYTRFFVQHNIETLNPSVIQSLRRYLCSAMQSVVGHNVPPQYSTSIGSGTSASAIASSYQVLVGYYPDTGLLSERMMK